MNIIRKPNHASDSYFVSQNRSQRPIDISYLSLLFLCGFKLNVFDGCLEVFDESNDMDTRCDADRRSSDYRRRATTGRCQIDAGLSRPGMAFEWRYRARTEESIRVHRRCKERIRFGV